MKLYQMNAVGEIDFGGQGYTTTHYTSCYAKNEEEAEGYAIESFVAAEGINYDYLVYYECSVEPIFDTFIDPPSDGSLWGSFQ